MRASDGSNNVRVGVPVGPGTLQSLELLQQKMCQRESGDSGALDEPGVKSDSSSEMKNALAVSEERCGSQVICDPSETIRVHHAKNRVLHVGFVNWPHGRHDASRGRDMKQSENQMSLSGKSCEGKALRASLCAYQSPTLGAHAHGLWVGFVCQDPTKNLPMGDVIFPWVGTSNAKSSDCQDPTKNLRNLSGMDGHR
ncbi:hypothetical protein AXG93_3884s1230 [Marchantia polymorpha subsp. ruderalis]|uniref:Uncharacterized protein n=1 Tax=Marchantia polymorpha subsp. ruderalis TaxID=1480154 RepID=A0A176W9G5_MARPO|nr:hypothetical protein AXG93_3884s1230 [Marchantia polymorpha subsp. ruderalis]